MTADLRFGFPPDRISSESYLSGEPGAPTDEEAQQIAASITSQPRPAYLHKDQDYPTVPHPVKET